MLLRCEKKHQMGMEQEGEANFTCVASNHSFLLLYERIFSWESWGKKRVKDGQQQGETSFNLSL
jgi:hypothetical protein